MTFDIRDDRQRCDQGALLSAFIESMKSNIYKVYISLTFRMSDHN